MRATTEYVLDSTALIALVSLEPGHEKVAALMDRATISAVNLAETVQKLVQEGSAPRLTESLLRQLELEVVDWSEDTAYRSAEFARLGKSHGLSLGDRACLTLAKQLNATAVTSDSAGRSCPTLALQ